jgi:dihydrofolate reductase/thymidylate synthase
MPINLIACVTNYKNQLAIGRNNDLIIRLKQDMTFFKNITTNNLSSESKLTQNVVLMGRKTWFSIPREHRPLKNRVNLVLTNDKDLLQLSPYNTFSKSNLDIVYFITYKQFLDFYGKFNPNVFVIGGNEIYNLFLNNDNHIMKPSKVFLTEVYNYKVKDGLEPDTFMTPLDQSFKLISVSEMKKEKDLNFRFLTYKYYNDYKSEENKYIDLIKYILNNGEERPDRTGVGTIGIFGAQMKFDISQSIPLLTSKRIPFKAIVEELLFFINGHTDVKILQDKGVKIWNGNTTRDFLDARNLKHYRPGIMGPMYGWQWRFFGANYSQAFADTTNLDFSKVGGFDQLKHVENLLKTDPYSRRIYISNLNPLQSSQMVLEPCFPAGTLVLTNNGYKNIEEITKDDLLYTHARNWKNILTIHKTEYDDEMYEFQCMYNTKRIKTTKEHPFYVKDVIRKNDKTIIGLSEAYWCKAKDFKENEQVICFPINKENKVPKFEIEKGLNQNKKILIAKEITLEEEWFMLGYFIGDGWIDLTPNHNRFYFAINKEQMYVYDILSKFLHLTIKKSNETDKLMVYSCSNKIWYEIIKEFGHLAHNKKIPEWIQDAPKEYIQWFINGYFAADGCKSSCRYTTVSPHIAYGLQRLYAKLGKILSVQYQKRPTQTIIENRLVNQRDTYNMVEIKNECKKYLSLIDDDYIYFQIRNIKKFQEKCLVYNFEVEDDNTYIVQNLAVHNCHCYVQLYVTEENGQKYLSGYFTMRSSDSLAWCYNIVSYTILIYILALKCNMKPKEIIYNSVDCHIYKTHIEGLKEQISRNLRPFPKIILDNSIKNKDWNEIVFKDISLVGYFPNPGIKMDMAV